MKLISILSFEFKRGASLGDVALQSITELRVRIHGRTGRQFRSRVGGMNCIAGEPEISSHLDSVFFSCGH